MKLIAAIAIAVATLAGCPKTSVAQEPTHDSEILAAYCIGVFGADQASLKSLVVPVCLTNEPADQCFARIADIDQERQRVDSTLRRLQNGLAMRGIVAPERYVALAKYLVATSCWESL